MPKRFPDEFKRDVVRVARQRDRTISATAKDFGVSTSTLQRWLAQADVDDGVVEGVTSDELAEIAQLRKDKRRLEQENEILRRAAAYFAKDALPK